MSHFKIKRKKERLPISRLDGRHFFGDELGQANYVHFLKAYASWIEKVYNIKFQKRF